MKLKQTKKNPEEFEEMLLKTSQYKAAQQEKQNVIKN